MAALGSQLGDILLSIIIIIYNFLFALPPFSIVLKINEHNLILLICNSFFTDFPMIMFSI